MAGLAGAGPTCEAKPINADQVVWLGDTWITFPPPSSYQQSIVRDHAREAGAIAMDEDFVMADGAGSAALMSDVANQYKKARDGSSTPIKVLLMDGGTLDTIQGMGSTASVSIAAAAFATFLEDVAADGTVEHIVYFIQPPLPGIYGVTQLKPLVMDLCSESTMNGLPCHFIDLESIWDPGYTGAGGIQPGIDGATAIGGAIWETMTANCVMALNRY
jgi:hypothetical protein